MKSFRVHWLFIHAITIVVQIATPCSSEAIRSWIEARCGERGSAVWMYEGTLSDPVDGRTICHVEGLELVRTLSTPQDNENRRLGLVSNKLSNSTTVLSRKFFCYKSPDDPSQLLSSIKLRPNSPTRPIPTNQAVAFYDTATTITSMNADKQLVLHTEFPNGKCYWATADSIEEHSSSDETSPYGTRSLDFSVFTKKRPTDLPSFTEDVSKNTSGLIIAPKRSKIIQFGASPNSMENGRFGARETYSYTMTQKPWPLSRRWKFWAKQSRHQPTSTCTVKYTRYGEGPPWYGPGKFLSLELRGKRVAALPDLSLLPETLKSHVPLFTQANHRIDNDLEAIQAVQAFKESGLVQFSAGSDTATLRQRIQGLWGKVRSASSHRSGTSFR